jgi:replication factor C large subunit
MIWADKYSPQKLNEIVGDKPPLLKLQDFVLNHSRFRKKAMIIHGPTGTGKTSSVYAIAKENNFEVIEVNSSDVRNKKGILETFGDALTQSSLFNKGKIFLFDDIDGLSGTKDRGGIQAVISLFANTAHPIILTSNDLWNRKFSSLRSKTEIVEFKPISHLEILRVLRRICKEEKLDVTEEVLKAISIKNEGDARSAITDLQAMSIELEMISKKDVENLGYRERDESIFNLLQIIFKTKDLYSINEMTDSVPLSLDEIMLWVEENVTNEYYGEELSNAFEKLSKADLFRGRIRRNQHWRFLVYQKFFMGAGVALSKTSPKKEFSKYSRPQRILKLWRAKMRYARRKEISEIVAKKLHISSKKAVKDVIPYLRSIAKNEGYIEDLHLDEDQLNTLS